MFAKKWQNSFMTVWEIVILKKTNKVKRHKLRTRKGTYRKSYFHYKWKPRDVEERSHRFLNISDPVLRLLVSTEDQNILYSIGKMPFWGNCYVFQNMSCLTTNMHI